VRSLDAPRVIDIRERAAKGEKHEAIAADHRIERAMVGLIASGKRWKHVGGPVSRKQTLREKYGNR
jgi:hypothetical protein